MKNSWLIWVFLGVLAVTVVLAFNYQASRKGVPLSEIFPEDGAATTETQPAVLPAEEITVPAGKMTSSTTAKAPASQSVSVPSTAVPSMAPAVHANAASSAEKIPFTIQISSFREQSKAQEILNQLAKKNYPAYLISRNLGEKGTWYRVYVGKFQTKNEAETLLAELKTDYKDSFIISPK